MIVDDIHIIIGSANINDRSQLGDRDSEVAIHAFDESGKFGKSLRKCIWSVALGIESNAPVLDLCPSEDHFFQIWNNLADENFKIFDSVFAVLPNDEVFSMPTPGEVFEKASDDYKAWRQRHKDLSERNATQPEIAASEIKNIKARFVILEFLLGQHPKVLASKR